MGRPGNRIIDGKLRCVRCGEDKPVDQFHRHHATKTGYRGTCKACLGHDGPVGRPPKLAVDGMDTCTQCGQTKPVSSFGTDKKKKSGIRSTCKECDSSRTTAYMGQSLEHYLKHVIIRTNLANLKIRQRRRNKKAAIWLESCVTFEYLMQLWEKQVGKCAVTGLPMTWVTGGRSSDRQYNVSVDRIDSEQGYVDGNVQLVCKAINLMKHDFTGAEFRFWCQAVISRNSHVDGGGHPSPGGTASPMAEVGH